MISRPSTVKHCACQDIAVVGAFVQDNSPIYEYVFYSRRVLLGFLMLAQRGLGGRCIIIM